MRRSQLDTGLYVTGRAIGGTPFAAAARWLLVVVVALASLWLAGAAQASGPPTPTKTWGCDDTSDWNTASCWSPTGVPGAGDYVFIGSGIRIDESVVAASVELAGSTMCLLGSGSIASGSGGLWVDGTGVNDDIPLSANGPADITGNLFVVGGTTISNPCYPYGINGTTASFNGATTIDGRLGVQAGENAVNNGTMTINAGVSHGTFTNNGSVVISNANAGLGPDTLVNNGSISIQGEGTMVNANPGTWTNNAGGTIDIGAGATLGNNGGSGTLLTLAGGELTGDGTIEGGVQNNGGTVSPGGDGTVGTLTIESGGNVGYTQSSGGTLRIDLRGNTPGTNMDQLQVGGALNLNGGSLYVDSTGYAPAAGVDHPVIDVDNGFGSATNMYSASFAGAFGQLTGPAAAAYTPIYPSPTGSAPYVVNLRSTASTGGSGGGGGGSGGGGSGGGGAGAVTAAQIKALLLHEIVPMGKAALIRRLLKADGYVFEFKALASGKAVIQWYQVPRGARLATARHKPKPLLIATGRLTFSSAGSARMHLKLTAAGVRLLRHAQHLSLTAKGTFTPVGTPAVTALKKFKLKR